MSLNPARILIVDNNSPFVLPLLRSFSREPDIRLDVLVCTEEKRIRPFRRSRYLHRMYRTGELSEENFLATIGGVLEKSGADLIIPTREWISKLFHSHLAELEEMVLVHPGPEARILDITGDKWNLNRWLDENGYPCAESSRPEMGWHGDFPVLLKPRIGIAGQGIRYLDSPEDVKMALSENGLDLEEHFFQEYLSGRDIDISFFAVEGKILFHTIQQGILKEKLTYSRGIEFLDDDSLLELASSMVRNLNYTGIAHLDFRYISETDTYFLVDFNARYWSSLQGSRNMGVNFPVLVTAFCQGTYKEQHGFRKGHFYFSTTALRILFRNLYRREKQPIRLRDTQLACVIKDPLPEIYYLISSIFSSRKR